MKVEYDTSWHRIKPMITSYMKLIPRGMHERPYMCIVEMCVNTDFATKAIYGKVYSWTPWTWWYTHRWIFGRDTKFNLVTM